MKKQIKEDSNKWKHIPSSWIGRMNIIKMITLPKATNGFNTIPIKTPMTHFIDVEHIFPKFMRKHK